MALGDTVRDGKADTVWLAVAVVEGTIAEPRAQQKVSLVV